MREFIKAVNSYSWAMSLFGFQQIGKLIAPSDGAHRIGPIKAMEGLTNAAREQFGPTLDSTFTTGDRLQRVATDVTFFMLFPFIMFSRDAKARRVGRAAENTHEEHAHRTGEQHTNLQSMAGRKA